MAPRLKPLRKDEELAAIPVDQPVLVELAPEPSGAEPDKGAEREVDDGVKTLEQQLAASKEAERQAQDRERAERLRADEAEAEANRVKSASVDTEKELLTNSLAGAQAESTSAKESFKKAFEAGDSDAMADAQEKIGRAAARVLQFEGAVAQFDEDAKAEKDRPEPKVDIITAIDRDTKLLPTERDWLKAHTEVLTDSATNRELSVGYDRAIKAGHKRGTTGYFKFLDQFMGYAEPDNEQEAEDTSERPSIMGAPVSRESRSSTTGQPLKGSQIRIEGEERALARSMGLTDAQWARGKQQLEANKRADPEKYARR